MVKFAYLRLPLLTLLLTPAAQIQADDTYQGSRFADVWAATEEDPYQGSLPRYKVNLDTFYDFFKDRLQQASERTLRTRADVLPSFRKLLHPHGICMRGTWSITEDNPFSGYFKPGSKGLIIVRQSTATEALNRGEKRIFGFSGKIFPTMDPEHQEPLKTANFFTIDNLGGTYLPHFQDTFLTNDITYINAADPAFISKAPILLAVARAFRVAENVLNSIITIRQNYQVAELGESPGKSIITPKWLAIKGRPGTLEREYPDFRQELRLENNGGKLIFDILVASDPAPALPKEWSPIGTIELDAYTLSRGCDERLHFGHPKWRNDLKHTPEALGFEES